MKCSSPTCEKGGKDHRGNLFSSVKMFFEIQKMWGTLHRSTALVRRYGPIQYILNLMNFVSLMILMHGQGLFLAWGLIKDKQDAEVEKFIVNIFD